MLLTSLHVRLGLKFSYPVCRLSSSLNDENQKFFRKVGERWREEGREHGGSKKKGKSRRKYLSNSEYLQLTFFVLIDLERDRREPD